MGDWKGRRKAPRGKVCVCTIDWWAGLVGQSVFVVLSVAFLTLAAAASGGRRRGGQLRSGLGRTGQLREGRILKLLGLERLTALGRVGAVRVEVGRLELDQTAFLAAHKDVTPSAYLDRLVLAH